MNPQEFVAKWRGSPLNEAAGYQEHFLDICRLVGHGTPAESDPDQFTFQKRNKKGAAGVAFADVWLKGKFCWEYKSRGFEVEKAFQQLLNYQHNLDNPPLVIASDFETIFVRTAFNGFVKAEYRITLDHILDGSLRVDGSRFSGVQVLKACFEDPDRLKPVQTTEDLTREAAKQFGAIADDLRGDGKWGNKDEAVAKFLTRVLFCMFASDVGLLPRGIIAEVYASNQKSYRDFQAALADLFTRMSTGGRFGPHNILHFNGGLFDSRVEDLQVHGGTMHAFVEADRLNWADVEPSVFGTLFERILNPDKRSQLGAHYTHRSDIELIVKPVLMWPFEREWDALHPELETIGDSATPDAPHAIRQRLQEFIDRLGAVRVLDPACGSGNFLYVSLAMLKELEQKVIAFGTDWGVTDLQPKVHPRQLYGIEKDPYAHELASIVVWIGYLQWKHRNGIPFGDEIPVLQPLDNVKHMDAVLDLSDPAHPKEPEWPEAEVIVGNPPFLGTTARMRRELSDRNVDALFEVYQGRVKHGADLCCYWHEKARAMIEHGATKRAGLLATQAIRKGASRQTLDQIKRTGDIFFAESNRPWILEGAAIRVSMVGFDDGTEIRRVLNGKPVTRINADLTYDTDVTSAYALKENIAVAYHGDKKGGDFELTPAEAERLLREPLNVNGRPNSDVVVPWLNGKGVTGRPAGSYIIDFGTECAAESASQYEAPFELLRTRGQPDKAKSRGNPKTWWLHERPRPEMRQAVAGLDRFLTTPRVAKHRTFKWVRKGTLPDSRLCVFARDDDYFFGILHAKVHQVWALANASSHGVGNDPTYNSTTCFETFPFPRPTDAQKATIAAAAKELNELRENWLNPPEGSLSIKDLNKRTLTNLYNARPAWLANAHRNLDRAVFSAYGWPDDLPDQDILARLLELNLQREQA